MPTYMVLRNRSGSNDDVIYINDYDRSQPPAPQTNAYDRTKLPAPKLPPRKWPPAPSVEDELTSLLREDPTSLHYLEPIKDDRGTIDQLPILVEIGKEHEIESVEPKSKSNTQPPSHQTSSSEGSPGAATPSHSSGSEEDCSKCDPKPTDRYQPPTITGGNVGQNAIGRRDNFGRSTERDNAQNHGQTKYHPPATFYRSSSARQAHPTTDNISQRLYPGTLEELKIPWPSNENMVFAQRQRTMSGSNNAADHRPNNMRHMSAMGYSGESQTPSFPRDHPGFYASPVSTISQNMPQEFQRPRERDNMALTTDSESDISPDEFRSKRQRQRTVSKSGARHQALASELASGSPYPSPPTSPRPVSRDGSLKVVYPTIKKGQHGSRQSSPVRASSGRRQDVTDTHIPFNIRYPSKPSSPNLRADMMQPHDGAQQQDPNKSQNSPLIQVPRSSQLARPGLTVDVSSLRAQRLSGESTVNQEMKQRPVSLNGLTNAWSPMSEVPMSAPNSFQATTPKEKQITTSAEAVKKSKQQKGQLHLIACPRPGFTTNHNDWMTMPQIPDLDLCPDCKDSLQENGFDGKFVKSQSRPLGTRTRCDMNVPWVRIAWLLILSGREEIDLLEDILGAIADEEECPSRQGGLRKKWYRVYDQDNDKYVSDFYVCSSCVRTVRLIFPNLKSLFQSSSSSSLQARMCDLNSSVSRFAKYVDLLEDISTQATRYREEPQTKTFVRMAKDFAGIRLCQRDDQFRGVPWHYISNFPDLTVCEECFMDVVRPAQRAGFDLADQINKKLMMPPDVNMKLSCQLYSPRMRAIFEECCRNRDMSALQEHTLARVNKERDLQHRVDLVHMLAEERREQEMQRLIEEWRRWE